MRKSAVSFTDLCAVRRETVSVESVSWNTVPWRNGGRSLTTSNCLRNTLNAFTMHRHSTEHISFLSYCPLYAVCCTNNFAYFLVSRLVSMHTYRYPLNVFNFDRYKSWPSTLWSLIMFWANSVRITVQTIQPLL